MRFLTFGIVVLVAAFALTIRMVYLQLVSGTTYTQLATSNSTFQQAIPSTRGLIYDRNGLLLVSNQPSYTVEIRPSDLPFDQRATVVAQLASLLKMDAADINSAIDANPGSTFDLVRIASGVPVATANLIAEEHLDLPGVQVTVDALRHYTEGPLMSQILGYTGAIDATTLKRLSSMGYLPDDLIGRAGVEEEYETQLRGTYGMETIQRDATGRQIQVLSTDRQPVAGDSLTLTLDTKMQQQAQTAVDWAMKASHLKSAVLIAMNPQTGEILAMVSTPTYDDNEFAQGISNAQFQALLKNPDHPLLNHAISEQFPEGSTYKLVTGSGALADGKLTPTTLVQTHPYIQIGADKFWDWNHAGFGAINVKTGFAHSSDTFFYQVAEMLGINRLAYWGHQFGFGAPTGIDLPGEVGGIVPDNQWKQAIFGQAMLPGEVVQSGIGQGFDTATPLQLLNAYAALANGGTLYQPQVVRQITGARRERRPGRSSRSCSTRSRRRPACSRRCARRPGWSSRSTTRTTWSTSRSSWPARPGPPSSASATPRAGCRTTTGSSASSRSTATPRSPTRSWRSSASTRMPTRSATRPPRWSSTSCRCTSTRSATCAGST